MNFQSGKNEVFDSFTLNVTLDKTGPKSQDILVVNIQGLSLKNTGRAELKGGLATITGQLTITDENNLHGKFTAELDNVSLSIPEQKGNELANTIAQSLSTIDRINISVGISGTINNYQLDIKSNLSEIISKGIKNVILVGVHTNMCVLGRPFGLRQMAQNGKNVVLMRDMTDTMYNPGRAPYVSHFTGTDLIVEHIEKWVCPTKMNSKMPGTMITNFN